MSARTRENWVIQERIRMGEGRGAQQGSGARVMPNVPKEYSPRALDMHVRCPMKCH
jgi:hypothetical protein